MQSCCLRVAFAAGFTAPPCLVGALVEEQIAVQRGAGDGDAQRPVGAHLRQRQPNRHGLHGVLVRLPHRQDLRPRLLQPLLHTGCRWELPERRAASVDVERDEDTDKVSAEALLISQAEVMAQLVRGECAGQAVKKEEVTAQNRSRVSHITALGAGTVRETREAGGGRREAHLCSVTA